jgi:hypothetical protein
MSKRSRTLLMVLSAGLLALSPVRAQEVLYAAVGSNGKGGNLYMIDPGTAAMTVVGPIVNASGGLPIAVTGLAFHPLNGKLYGVTSGSGQGGGNNSVLKSLVTIDPTTGVATVIGSLGSLSASDISFRSDGTLFGYQAGGQGGGSRSMLTINLTTGAATAVGTTGYTGTAGGGLAFGPSGILYLSAIGGNATLDSLNTTTGAIIPGGPTMFGAPVTGGGVMNSMKFNAAGILYAINSDQNVVTTTNYLVTINPDPGSGTVAPVGPGALSIGNVPVGNIDAMAFDPGTSKQFKIISKVGSTATMTIDSLPGYTYQLQRSDTGLPGTFANIGSSQNGNGSTLTFTDPTATNPAAFYRVSIGHIPGANPGPLKAGRRPAK